ncbi:MAG: hypothetical protein J7M14_02560 [Planctomycetes bacterium]|nr:hypothetical protein [Planctomycetota bacterium]
MMIEQLDIPYIEADDGSQRLDMFMPDSGRSNGVCMVLIHGGGFTAGGRSSWHGVARQHVELGCICEK